MGWTETAGPSAALRFGRDDKLLGDDFYKELMDGEKLQVPPLRFAPVGMTKFEGGRLPKQGWRWMDRV
jgi:hypothetical protein